MSNEPYAGIQCKLHGDVDITKAEYMKQMANPNAVWVCPKCRAPAKFDDLRYEALNPIPED